MVFCGAGGGHVLPQDPARTFPWYLCFRAMGRAMNRPSLMIGRKGKMRHRPFFRTVFVAKRNPGFYTFFVF